MIGIIYRFEWQKDGQKFVVHLVVLIAAIPRLWGLLLLFPRRCRAKSTVKTAMGQKNLMSTEHLWILMLGNIPVF